MESYIHEEASLVLDYCVVRYLAVVTVLDLAEHRALIE